MKTGQLAAIKIMEVTEVRLFFHMTHFLPGLYQYLFCFFLLQGRRGGNQTRSGCSQKSKCVLHVVVVVIVINTC